MKYAILCLFFILPLSALEDGKQIELHLRKRFLYEKLIRIHHEYREKVRECVREGGPYLGSRDAEKAREKYCIKRFENKKENEIRDTIRDFESSYYENDSRGLSEYQEPLR